MPRSTSPILTEAELRLMDVLWQRGPSTVQEVQLDEIRGETPENDKEKDGRAHVYRAVVRREDASRSEIELLVSRFFEDSHERLVLNILESRKIDPEELRRLRKMLEDIPDESEGR